MSDPYISLPQIMPQTNYTNHLNKVSTSKYENEISNYKISNYSKKCTSDMLSDYESLPHIPINDQQFVTTFKTPSILMEQPPAKNYLNRMSSTLPRPPKNKPITVIENYLDVNNPSKIAFLQSLDYNDRVEVKPVKGRNSIIQTPCLNNTYHDVTSVSRTLPRQGKKLLRDNRSRQNDSHNIQSEEESIY